MRNIKFKAKSKATRQWVNGSLVNINGKYFICYSVIPQGIIFEYVIPDTICEYIGYPDDFKHDLYEYDIVEITYTDVDYITAGQLNRVDLDTQVGEEYTEVGVIRENAFGFDAFTSEGKSMYIYYRWYNSLKKIGNIFDNPELIKGGRK